MEQIVDFPDPADYNYPEEVRLPDGTLLMGRTPGESPLIMNRKIWRLYPSFKAIRYKQYDDGTYDIILQSTQNGITYRMPQDPITVSIVDTILHNPGIKPEEVMGTALALQQQAGVDLSNEDRMFAWAFYVYDAISLLAVYGLIRIEM
ncbi:hypothetical protein GFS03_08255 [Sulfolobus sp. E5-1-F]|uniref:hypothetical protein n=1 Tax=Saccharolobus sp. E5-1-F TaxID=2663019 RepID=UPI00129777E9|nr:hypothetical protein [Sulfolobus sp. E5-1-F]QGA54562.1 hypothetical protein GFS03_08255 [Sulfolobus sp. E5-1-F]